MAKTIGVIPPCITFFDASYEIDLDTTRDHVEWLIKAGVHGLLVIGTCGEFFSLDIDEREKLAEFLITLIDGRIPIYVGVMHTSTRTAIRLAKAAERAGATGISSVSPYYSSPPEREVLKYFRDLASAVNIPLMVYNNPGASGVSLSVPALAGLAQDGTAAIIKDSHGDPSRIHDLRLMVPESTSLIYGEDFGAFEAIMAGADGWVAGVGNMIPRHSLKLWELATKGNLSEARKHLFRILPLINMTSHKTMFGRPDERPDFIQIYKATLDFIGRKGGVCRPPLMPLTNEDKSYLMGLVRELNLTQENA